MCQSGGRDFFFLFSFFFINNGKKKKKKIENMYKTNSTCSFLAPVGRLTGNNFLFKDGLRLANLGQRSKSKPVCFYT